jgi:hypothetical protein
MAQRAISIYVLLAVAALLMLGLLFAQPASPTLAGFTPTRSHGGTPTRPNGGGGGGGGGGQIPESKRVVPPPIVVIAGATIVATPVPTPLILPITGGSIDDESPVADQAPQDSALTSETIPLASALFEPALEAPQNPQANSLAALPSATSNPQPPVAPPAQAQPISIVVPPEWLPGPSQATLIVINDAGGDIVFTMGDQERQMPPHTQTAIIRPAGRYGFTVTDPRFQSYRNECDLAAASIYYWYTDDSMNSDRCALLGP